MTTYCDVNTCEDCPRYGDDCDGDKRLEHTDLISRADAIELLTEIVFDEPPYFDSETLCRLYAEEQINKLPSAELTLQTTQTYGKSINPSNAEVVEDYISRADAIEAVEGLTKYMEKLVEGAEKFPEAHTKNYKHDMEQQIVGVAHASQVILELPSADAVPTVIRAKTFMRKEDFDKWAEDIKKQNKSIVCIPCDAEVVSADAVTHEIRTETHGVCLISKDDAMGAVQDHFNANGFKGYDDGQKMMDRIKALPSADAVHGEWEDREVFSETDDGHIVEEWQSARCSVCGKYHTTPYMYYFDDFNFCPNCGARMKGGDEE